MASARILTLLSTFLLVLLNNIRAEPTSISANTPLLKSTNTSSMDPALYKDVTTSRGLTYHYYFSPAAPSQPTLLFCHGHPSTSHDWRRVVPHFQARGYGIIAPDMLGYGGTDKPTDPAYYLGTGLAKDMVDILDAEGIDTVIAVAHDWGSRVTSRMANYYPERVTAYAWLAVPYQSAFPLIDFQTFLNESKQVAGYELYGYWLFFSEDDADEIIQEHIDSYIAITFPIDPTFYKYRFAPTGALKANLLDDFWAPLPPYLTEADKATFIETFRAGHFTAPMCWYKVYTDQMAAKDDMNIPAANAYPPASAPVFYASGKYDYVCLPSIGNETYAADGFQNHSITLKEYETDHWILLAAPDQLSQDLEAWIEGFRA